MTVVVTAASGHLGRLVVHDLLERGVPANGLVAGARSVGAITDLAETGVRTTVIDYDDPASVEAALEPGDTFVLVSGNDLANRDRQHADAIGMAAKAGAGHLIYTSGLKASESPSPIAASHAATEDVVRDSGIPYTLLRNGWYTENYARSIDAVRAAGVLLASVGDAGSPPPPAATSPRPSAQSSPPRVTSVRPTSSPVRSPGPTATSPPPSPSSSAAT